MRVVYFAEIFPSASETWVHHEITSLQSLGCEVHVVATHAKPNAIPQELERFVGITTYYPQLGSPNISIRSLLAAYRLLPIFWGLITDCPTFRLRAQVLRDLFYVVRLFPTLEQMRPDVVVAHFAGTKANLALFYTMLSGTPFLMKMHARDVFVRVALLRLKIRWAKEVLTISEFNARYIERNYPDIDSSRLRKHACGIPLDEYLFRPHVKTPQPPIITFVGRLVAMKGLEVLLRATRIIIDKGLDVKVRIVGDGPERENLRRQIMDLSLQDVVELKGYCSPREVHNVLLDSSMFVLPALWDARYHTQDGIPVALMEAMAVGVPVVSTKTSGIPELVRDGVTGFLAEPADPVSLANEICKCLAMGWDMRTSILINARQKIEQDHNIQRLTSDLLQFLKASASKQG